MGKNRGGIPIAYILYGLALFCLLVLIFLPYRRLTETLVERWGERSGVSIQYSHFDYSFPASCSLQKVAISLTRTERRIPLYVGDSLDFKISPFKLLGRKLAVSFRGEGYGGDFSGRVSLPIPVRSESGDYHLNVRKVRVEEMLAPYYLRDFKIEGNLTGEADFRVPRRENFLKAVGQTKVTLTQGRVRNILIRGLDLPDFDFQSFDAEAKLADGIMKVAKCSLVSDIFLAEIHGEVLLDPTDVRESHLNLTARLKPKSGDPINLKGVAQFFNKSLDREGYYIFQLRGTFRYPELT
jgi:type II secretion system protein N